MTIFRNQFFCLLNNPIIDIDVMNSVLSAYHLAHCINDYNTHLFKPQFSFYVATKYFVLFEICYRANVGKYNTLIQVLARNIFLFLENEPLIPKKNVAS